MDEQKSLLIVDDEPNIRRVLEAVFTKDGYQVQTAENGRKALDILATDPNLNVAVCDLIMPDMNGVEVLKAAKEINPRLSVVMITAHGTIKMAVDAMKLVRRIVAQPPLARYGPQEFRPGPTAQSDADLLEAARALGTTIFHPVGTAKMGTASDPMAVTDERLRVFGVPGLRIADASVMPRIVSGNTNSPTMMIAEKAAAMIAQDARG